MESNEDGDLIDLDNSEVCVPRRSLHTDTASEEQEHLLDVCPPKLEQKLSLTVKHELTSSATDNGNILVTLGHDQVVPIRKRIDVVSSDTIKRVRDITRNLEPMMTQSAANSNLCDTVDHGSESSLERGYKRHETDEETYEARAISNAFDFLAEHEAEEEDEGERKVRGILKDSRGSRLTNRESSNVIINADLENGPANDFVLVTSNQVDSKVSWHRLDPIGAVSRTKRRAVKCRRDRGNSHDEGQQETKRRSIDENEKRRRSRRSRRNDHRQRGSWNIDRTEEDSTFSRVNSRKSVSLEECCVPFASDSSDVLRRSDFVDEEEAEENDEEEEQTDDDDDVDKEEEESSVIRTPEDVCSSNCSEVDWSWLEEVESGGQAGRKGDPSVNETLELEGTTRDSSVGRRRGGGGDSSRQDEASLLSLAMSVVVTGNSLATGSLGCPSGSVRLSAADTNVKNVVQSSATRWTVKNENATMHRNASNEAIDRENHAVTTSSSWVRASMRRLRHLRLPESSARQRTSQVEPTSDPASNVSAPNSLPDIALIAPEILAAQTNSSSMSIGSGTRSCSSSRPLSAPARNSGNHGVGTPRRFTRQYGVGVPSSRSRCSSSMVAPDNPATRDAPFSLSSLSSSSSQSPTSSSPAPLQTSSVNLPSVSTPNSSSPTSSNCQPHVVVPAPSSTSSSSGQNSSVASSTTTNISDATMSAATTCSSSFGPTTNVGGTPQRTGARRICERQRGVDRDGNRGGDDDDDENPLGRWPHALSPALACLGCTLGLYNISRFAILSIQFGANFIVQFLMLSLTLGIPLLTLQVCLGQRLAAGSVDMWKISPLFQGVGIALLTAQAFIGIYGIVGVSWMFVYFRDSFITKQDRYRWAEPFLLYREDSRPTHNTSSTYKLYETVPDYFSGVVLQRHHLNDSDPSVITLKFQVAFNLAVVWMIVFVSLSKGLRSYGKVVYVFTLVPVFGTLILCTKLLGLTPPGSVRLLFPATVWSEFFINGKSWVAASTEVFLTWGLLGAAAMQIAAHNKHKHLLQRDTSLVVVLTFVVLLLAAFLANTCVQILRHHGFIYTTSSFERISGYTFMRMVSQPAPQWYSSTPERFMTHASFIIGQRVTRPSADLASESGYQVLRLSTELVPATLALLGTEQVSPFWAVLFYFILILFGIAQQLAIWHCVITGIMAINTKMMKLWETTITFFSCACAYILGLPMATELGIYVIYYLDYTIGGAWWIMVLYLVQVGAVFAVRGRPHSGEAVVAELFPPTGRCLRHWAGPLLSFTWNVILPVTLMVLSITVFKNGRFRELYSYRRANREYWSLWARQLGATIQLIPILMIPAVAIIQTCRYLNNGPPDIFDRIQLLYRPSLDPEDPREVQMQIGNESNTSIHGNGILPATTDIPFEDPPPKYTPPPSYTTATGVRIAKMLRQSFRRSVRRIANVLGESSAPRQRPALQPPPPDYATVLVEMNQSTRLQNVAIHVTDPRPDVITNIGPDCNDTRHRSNTIDRMTRIGVVDRCTIERTHSTLDRAQRSSANPSSVSANLTAADVANLLRSSIRRGTARTQQSLRRSFCREESTAAVSVENLVEAAAPIGQDSLILPKDLSLVPDERISENNDDNKTANEMETSVSVI